MQVNSSRHLAHLFRFIEQKKEQAKKQVKAKGLKAAAAPKPEMFEIPPEFNGKDYLAFLLSIDAELEHGLMLQYLYAAYSLGGPQVPAEHRDKVREWQEIILGIAKEEMGHFVSVQNVLRLIGAPLHFERQDYPWDTPFYPFPFKLEPLTIEAIAKYVYVESPVGWIDSGTREANEIKEIISAEDHGDPISVLFEVVLQLVKDRNAIPDEVFQIGTYPFQAKFDEWGRGYAGGKRGNTTEGHAKGAPDVLVAPLASRDDAYNSLMKISEQGEATKNEDNDGQPSHFKRFLYVYTEMRDALATGDWHPARNLAINPYIDWDNEDPNSSPAEGQVSSEERDMITNPVAVNWAHLCNVRYRMLLAFITHSFKLDGGFNDSGAYSPRGTIINATFGEMYNIRSIANVLVKLPISRGSYKYAGPPFLIPYTLELPIGEHNRWRVHRDLVMASKDLIKKLRRTSSGQDLNYLKALQEADDNLLAIIDKLTAPALS